MLLAGAGPGRAARVGEGAPGFSLPDRAGRRVALAELRGRVVCLDFWASWCASCRTALPALDAIARRHRDAGLEVVAVDIDAEPAAGDRFLAEHLPAPAMTVLRDPEGTVLREFDARAMPALYLIDRRGTVRAVEVGYDPRRLEAVERQIAELLAEPPATRDYGQQRARPRRPE
jgi:thiol-disulfide isomerase/thioredoxin